MWLIITALAAVAVTGIYLIFTEKYRLGALSLVFWALSACIFVDHTLGWLADGGEYFDISVDALLLSIVMLIPIFAVWELYLLKDKVKARAVFKGTIASEID